MPAPATPKHSYVHADANFVRVYDVDWTGSILTLPSQTTSPRTAQGYEVRLFPATTDLSTAAALAVAVDTHNLYRDAAGLWTVHRNGASINAGPLQMTEWLGGTTVNVDADYQVLPTGLTYAAGGGGGGGSTVLTDETVSRLMHTGFSPRSAKTLGTAATSPGTVDWKTALRRGDMSPRQARTLRNPPAGGHTMSSLLRGGFTRHQAKLILGG